MYYTALLLNLLYMFSHNNFHAAKVFSEYGALSVAVELVRCAPRPGDAFRTYAARELREKLCLAISCLARVGDNRSIICDCMVI